MRDRPTSRLACWPALGLLLAVGASPGCEGPKPPPRAVRPIGPLAIHSPQGTTKVFSGVEETPGVSCAFEGARGSVRVTMEVEGNPGQGPTPMPPSINDVLFQAEGDGRILVEFQRPRPEQPNGRVTIRCLSGDEESSAVFEPELWYHLPGAIVTLEAAVGESKDQVAEGKEIVLGRYVARNISRDIRLTFKAIFTREPVAPRTKAGLKPPR